MAALSAQEPSEWDENPAWTRPDPMTAAELEAGLDRVCEQDEGYREDEADQHGEVEPFTAEELAEIREAAADELLAVEAATTGRRGPGQPGSARGCRWTCCPAARSSRWPPAPRPGRTAGTPGCPRLSWPGWCARGTGSRP